MSFTYKPDGWQAFYASPDKGQQYRCINCDQGGSSASGSHKPLTYNCHYCKSINTMWPTPQHKMYRQSEDRMRAAVILLNQAENALTEDRLENPGDTTVPNTQEDRDHVRILITEFLEGISYAVQAPVPD